MSGGESLTYNAKNQTSSITPNGGLAINMTYAGDGQDQRVSAGSVGCTYSLLGLGSTTSGGSRTSFTRDNRGTLVGERLPDGSRYYYLFDGRGAVVGLTDSSGNLVNSYTYDPYGNVVTSTEAAW